MRHLEDAPIVSVVMPMRNAENYVRAALESVLEERRIALEVIVVDDGSTDCSRKVVEEVNDPRVRVVPGPQRGFSASFNAGLKASRADIIMECDADDLYVAGRIEKQVSWLKEHEDVDAVCGRFSSISPTGKLVAHLGEGSGQENGEFITSELIAGIVRTSFCTYAIRRRVFSLVGDFREFFESGPDIDFQLRIGEKCNVFFLPASMYLYRLHNQSITHTQSTARREFFEAAAFAFQVERQAKGFDSLESETPPTPPILTIGMASSAEAQIQGMLIGRAWLELDRGDKLNAINTAFRAVYAAPLNIRIWISAGKLMVLGLFFKRRTRM